MASETEEKSAAALFGSLGRKALVFDDDAVVHLLRVAIEREGSQSAFAKRYDVNRTQLNSILNGKKRVTALSQKLLGFAGCMSSNKRRGA